MSKTAVSKTATANPANKAVDAAEVRQSLAGKHVCPFCGVLRTDAGQPCPRCTLDDSAATRTATKQRIGPWFVLQARNPSAPGMKLATLQALVRRGHLTPRSVVRGPTTEQMWTFVANVRGLSREFGLCYHCGEAIDPAAAKCPLCTHVQGLPADSDALLENAVPPPPVVAPPAPAVPVVALEMPRAPVAPVAGLSPGATPVLPVTPDFLSSLSVRPSDTGMDGGTSLDLQADAIFPLAAPARPAPTRVAPPRPASLPRAPLPTLLPTSTSLSAPMKDEAILSARELAAAFQLDFKEPRGRHAKPRRPVRTLAAMLLILAVAGGIVLALRDDWRRTSFAWVIERWGAVAASLEQPAKPPASGAAVRSPTPTAPTGDGPATPPRDNAKAPPAPRPTPTPTPETAVVRVTPPVEPLPTPRVEPLPAPTPRAVPKVDPPAPTPAPTPLVVAPPVVRPPAPPSTSPPSASLPATDDLTIDQATTFASDLRLRAIDAQARGDWPAALKCYEQIQRLPKDAWPADLSMRLDIAKHRVGTP